LPAFKDSKNITNNQQLRQHLRPTLQHRLLLLWHRIRGVRAGGNVLVERGALLFRYPRGITLGDDVIVKRGSQICPCRSQSSVSIGARTTIGFYTLIYATSEICIGQDCMIAPFVYIVDSDHGTRRGELMNRQPNQPAAILISDDVWVGAHSVILKGVHVGHGAIIAAGSVVRENVPSFTIVGGVPAKIIGERK